jgi:membrane fusion protein (multidrug efflux system)
VRARLEQAVDESAIAVPQQAVIRGPEGATVLVVGNDNKVSSRPVKADASQDGSWIVSSGLKGGEKIIVEGFQKTKPGGTVTPTPWQGAPAGNAPGQVSAYTPPGALPAAPGAGAPPATANAAK